MRRTTTVALWLGALVAGMALTAGGGGTSAAARDAGAPGPAGGDSAAGGPFAYLFAYRAAPGRRAAMEKGYAEHLAWHRRHADRFTWYAWDVLTGDRVGLFIDGTFGLAGGAFERRVDPAGDAADFARTTAPFAEPAFRRVYRVRPELGSATPLEHGDPPAAFQAVYYRLRPGAVSEFEEAAAELLRALPPEPDAPRLTWYERMDGGEQPAYLLLVSRAEPWSYDRGPGLAALARAYLPDRSGAVDDLLRRAVAGVRSERWLYRRDLAYRAGGPGGHP